MSPLPGSPSSTAGATAGWSPTSWPRSQAGQGAVHVDVQYDLGNGQGMAQRDQAGGLFGRHDPGQPRHTQNIALFCTARSSQIKGRGGHGDRPGCNGNSIGDFLVTDIDHMGGTAFVKVG